jgi:hypothetical protein
MSCLVQPVGYPLHRYLNAYARKGNIKNLARQDMRRYHWENGPRNSERSEIAESLRTGPKRLRQNNKRMFSLGRTWRRKQRQSRLGKILKGLQNQQTWPNQLFRWKELKMARYHKHARHLNLGLVLQMAKMGPWKVRRPLMLEKIRESLAMM